MIAKDRDFLNIQSRNYLVNNEKIYFSSNITKFGDSGFRYQTDIIITDQAIYNYHKNTIKRRTSIDKIDALTISKRSSELVIHIKNENDYYFHIQDLRNDIIEALICIICELKKLSPSVKIYELELINLDPIVTTKGHVKNSQKVRPKEEHAKLWNLKEFLERERESINRRAGIRRKTQTLYVSPDSEKKDICLEDFELLKVLGEGSYAKVVLAQKKDNKKYYAIKILKKDKIIEKNQLTHTIAEKTVLQHANHPFLVGLAYAFQTESKLYFVLDFVMGGEMYKHLQTSGRFTEERTKFYAVCIILGLGFLHNQNYIYRDLKLENILLDDTGYPILTDFGLAKFLPGNKMTSSFCGTPAYLAPEIIKESGHNKMADWWSLGILIFEMLTGSTPFHAPDQYQTYTNIVKNEIKFSPDIPISPNAKNFIHSLLEKDPNKRIGVSKDSEELLAHPWFVDIKIQNVLEKKVTAPFIPDLKNIEKNFQQNFFNSAIRETVEKGILVDREKMKEF